MSMDAGTVFLSVPANGQATEAANAIAGNVTTTGDKAFFVAPVGLDVVEVGAVIGTATAATTYIFTVATAPKMGGAYTVQATVTGPATTIIAAGTKLKKNTKIHLDAGNVLRFSVTGAPASGTAQLYAMAYPAGTGTATDLTSTT
jgi:hypothetical protein